MKPNKKLKTLEPKKATKASYKFLAESKDKVLGRLGGSTPVRPDRADNDNAKTIPFRKK